MESIVANTTQAEHIQVHIIMIIHTDPNLISQIKIQTIIKVHKWINILIIRLVITTIQTINIKINTIIPIWIRFQIITTTIIHKISTIIVLKTIKVSSLLAIITMIISLLFQITNTDLFKYSKNVYLVSVNVS